MRTWPPACVTGRRLRDPLPHDPVADSRLIDAVRHDLRDEDGHASATAVRMIWTADHLDAARRLQDAIAGPARDAVRIASDRPQRWAFPRRPAPVTPAAQT